jgi:hypothetical protein
MHAQANNLFDMLRKSRTVQKAEKPDAGRVASIKKTDNEQQVVFGEVYAPDFPDSHGDFMGADAVRDMAYGFMKKGLLSKVDIQHSQEECGAYIVESFIARDDDPVFLPGSWVIGVHIPDVETWALVKSGELNGFSLDGFGIRVPTKFEIDMPELLKGETDISMDHKHGFIVKFDNEGNFLGGRTTEAADGHWHEIVKGTVTEDASGHNHRFSFIEGVMDAQAVG